ncbi:MAG: transposase [Acidobacteriales bacterium]|nr:transposase [Terriglobales bacterium]
MLLTNELSAKPAAILWVVIAYFKRWGVEEGTRLVKQIFDLENVRAMSFAGIRRVVLFAYLAYGFLCLFARRAGKAAVRAVLRLYKSFMPDAPPHYIYYRLACAVAVALMRAGP